MYLREKWIVFMCMFQILSAVRTLSSSPSLGNGPEEVNSGQSIKRNLTTSVVHLPSVTKNIQLGDAPIFRADLISANLDVAASSLHPHTASRLKLEAGQDREIMRSIQQQTNRHSELASHSFDMYPEKMHIPSFFIRNYSAPSFDDLSGLLQKGQLKSAKHGPADDSSRNGYYYDTELPLTGKSLAKHLHSPYYHEKLLVSPEYGYRDRSYEKPASYSPLSYADLVSSGYGSDMRMSVDHVPVWGLPSGTGSTGIQNDFATAPRSFEVAHESYPPSKKSKLERMTNAGTPARKPVFNYEDVLAAYHGREPSRSSPVHYDPTDPGLSPAASTFDPHAMSVYYSKDTVPYNTHDYKRYPYGYGSPLSALSTMSFPQMHSERIVESSGGDMALDQLSSTVRGFSGQQLQHGPDQFSSRGPQMEDRFVAPSATVPVEGYYTKQHAAAAAAALKPKIHSLGQIQKSASQAIRPTPGNWNPFLADGSTPTMREPLHRSRHSSMDFLAPILRNYLMRGGDNSYEHSEYDHRANRHAPFFAAFFR